MKRGKSTGKPTKAEQARLDSISKMLCICCSINLWRGLSKTGQPSEIHHLVDKGYRKHSGGHMATIPLCAWHHRGIPASFDNTVSASGAMFGPSLALHKRKFMAFYGAERELLGVVNDKLASGFNLT